MDAGHRHVHRGSSWGGRPGGVLRRRLAACQALVAMLWRQKQPLRVLQAMLEDGCSSRGHRREAGINKPGARRRSRRSLPMQSNHVTSRTNKPCPPSSHAHGVRHPHGPADRQGVRRQWHRCGTQQRHSGSGGHSRGSCALGRRGHQQRQQLKRQQHQQLRWHPAAAAASCGPDRAGAAQHCTWAPARFVGV